MKNKYFKIIFLFFLAFIQKSLLTNDINSYDGSFASLKNNFDDYKDLSFKLNELTYVSDIPFSKYEFSYLVGLKIGDFIPFKDIDIAYKQLKHIKRFKTIDINIKQQKDGMSLHFDLTANWIFKRIGLKGIWFDKNQYEELYLQQPGDVFDISLHEESVQAIKNLLREKGYFNNVVEDELVYEKTTKLVTVKINVIANRCFKIENLNFDLKNINKDDSSTARVMEKLKRNFKDDLIGVHYLKSMVEKQVKRIKIFLRKKGYLNCSVKIKRLINKRNNKIKIIFDIDLGKKWKIKFEGNRFFSKQQLKQNILSEDKPVWLFSPQIISEQLIQEYYKKGFWNIKINYDIHPNGAALFKIQEGRQIFIDSVIVHYSKKKDRSKDNLFFNELLNNRFYDETFLNLGLENLSDFYVRNGFWDFKFLEKRFVQDKKTGNYNILIIVEKGVQRFYGGVKIKCFKKLEDDPFFKKYNDVVSRPEYLTPFNVSWISEQRFFLLNHFQKQGYWYVEIHPELVETKLDKDRVKIEVLWRVDLREKIKFGKLLLRGNSSLPFRRILKELRFKQGEVWDKSKLDLTSSRFKKLDLFKEVQFQPYKAAKVSGIKPVILTLVDDDPYEVRFRLGYFLTSKNFLLKQQSTYKVGSSFIFKNPTNSADKLSFNADVTLFERNLNIDYQLPSPLGWPIISKAKAYANKYIQPVEIGKSGSAYEAIQNGFLVGLSNEYKNNYFWGLNIGDEWMETSQVRGNLNFAPELVDKTIPYVFVEPSLVIDTLDDRVNATKGTITFLSLKAMVPHKEAKPIFKIMLEQAFLKPIFGDVVGGVHFRWGHIFRQDFEYIMPIERFYLGGPHSVRGYEIDSIPPLGVSEKIENGEVVKIYTIQGGSSMLNGNLELRFPLFKSFKGVVFQDIGVLSQTGFSGFKGCWYPGTGFGFRYKTPIGPLRFDIGWKWKKRLPGDCPYAWYLTIGEAF